MSNLAVEAFNLNRVRLMLLIPAIEAADAAENYGAEKPKAQAGMQKRPEFLLERGRLVLRKDATNLSTIRLFEANEFALFLGKLHN